MKTFSFLLCLSLAVTITSIPSGMYHLQQLKSAPTSWEVNIAIEGEILTYHACNYYLYYIRETATSVQLNDVGSSLVPCGLTSPTQYQLRETIRSIRHWQLDQGCVKAWNGQRELVARLRLTSTITK